MPAREYEVASVNQLADGKIRQVNVEGTAVLLVPDGDTIYAVAATCPHAGAPLAEGIRHGRRLICPWHKATFCIRTGAVLEPPAVDPLARYDVRVEGTRVMLSEPTSAPTREDSPADERCFVIVGGGGAGAVAAQTLREAGFGGRIVLLDRENRVPYDRTILSKYALSGEPGAEKSPLQTQSFYKQHAIERRTAVVNRIDINQRHVVCADGSAFHYDAILLATGAAPKRPNLPGSDLGNVFVLRGRGDADAILAQAERSERVVVLGTSFIGMEVAASLRERGLEVTVVGKESAPFETQLGAKIGAAFVSLHQKRGVTFRLGRQIEALRGDREVRSVVLDKGETLPTDLVVIGFGVQPVTDYFEGAALNDDGSISVDSCLRVVEGVYAAGDIARFPLRGDGDPVRVEHWRVAEQHGRVAAMNMLGQNRRYDAVPVFWTIQYLKRLDYIGHATDWDDIVVHGDLNKPEFLAYYLKNGVVAAAAGLDRDRDTAALIELLTLRRNWTPSELGDSPATVLAAIGAD
jgi:apoptosis-inducing factor 3